ncbi:TraX family protein [Pseudobutyrivibrio sp.]|uniref:TraX family protein n=1 Tax=Pseudobutyrivibrio sp. TaxID=2014367 RepID=UPI001B75C8C7|nr:TraX family protein [Pseudobutyrivibrio sp.]MBP3261626.1 conjugal transfer protein TraX [Pseudobutyrivibrio sp.]
MINAEKQFEITGTGFKLIAVITMLIDHIAVGIVANIVRAGIEPFSFIQTIDLYRLMRNIGRMAFPIYCFMLVEGFIHTRNVKKYALRLLFIAVISEIPFDLVSSDTFFTLEYNNVLWELLLGLIVLYAIAEIDKKQLTNRQTYFFRCTVVLIGMAIAYFTNLDYGEGGICCIAVMYTYVANGKQKLDRLIAFALGVVILILLSGATEAWAFFMLIPMFYYEGNRGFDNKALRLFFYLFYPVHLLILALIANLFIL